MGIRALTILAVLAAALGACGDDGVAVRIELPDAYRDAVELLTIDVLEPEGDGFRCDEVAFGERSAAELQSVTSSRASFRRRDGLAEPIDIARAGVQLVVVRGFTVDGEPVVAGCTERQGQGTLVLAAVPMVRLEAPSPLELFDGELYGPMPDEVVITVRDFAGVPVPDITVRWSFDGPAGFARIDEGQSNGAGEVVYAPAVGDLFGPYRLRARSPWAFAPTPELISYEVGDTRLVPMPGEPRGLIALGGQRSNGEPALVASLAVGACPDRIVALQGAPRTFTPPCHLLGLVHLPAIDVPVLVTYGGGGPRLQRVNPSGTPLVTDCGPVSEPGDDPACVPRRIIDADPCNRSGRSLIVLECPGNVVERHIVDASTCPVTISNEAFGTSSGIDIRDSGCVDINGVPTNVFVANNGSRDVVYSALAPQTPRAIAGITRIYEVGQGADSSVMLGLTSNAGAIGIARFDLLGGAGTDPLIPNIIVSFTTPREPVVAASGDLDGDGIVDVFALGNARLAAESRTIMMCLGRDGDQALCAEGPTLHNGGVDLIAVGDVDGDAIWEFGGFDTSSIGAWELAVSSLAPR